MAEYVRMPKADYEAACNALRSRSGKTDLIKSGDLEAEILGISGGSSEDVRYVTFMSHDGTVELGKKAVAVGDDCADPIARDIFSTPTRESTAQYNYTFAGWATEPNGALDSTALNAVTEDRTVYATYISTVRYYTISYYDSDGTTLLKSEALPYGTMPTYKPEKNGVIFDGWDTPLVAVTSDASYIASWSEKLTFSDATWADIARLAESGEASKHFSVGDTKTINVTLLHSASKPDTANSTPKTYSIMFEIIGFDHDDLADGSGKAGLTIASYYALPSLHLADMLWGGLTYGWAGSSFRTKMNDIVFNNIDSNVRQYIKEVTKTTSGAVSAGRQLETTVDKVFVPSATEYFGNNAGYTTDGQGHQYERYAVQDNRKKPSFVGGVVSTSNVAHATRSNSSRSSSFNVAVSATGGVTDNAGNYTYAVMAFCI